MVHPNWIFDASLFNKPNELVALFPRVDEELRCQAGDRYQ